MKMWFVAVTVAVLATAASGQQTLNITGCTVPCNLGTTPADVVIFIDSSSGTGAANLALIKSALVQWQSPFGIGTSGSADELRVAIVDYSLYAIARGALSENHESHDELVGIINSVSLQNTAQRNIYYGLFEGTVNLETDGGMRAGVPKIGMIFSTGTFTGQSPTTVYQRYTNAGFVFYGLGVGLNSNIAELANLVGADNVFHTINAEQLQYVIGWLLNKACSASSGGLTTPFPGSSMGPTTPLPYRHCQDYCAQGDSSSGVKPILINGVVVYVYCNGCWTTIQSRTNGGLVDFNVDFNRYRQVLGQATNPPSDFYLGNDNIYWLTNQFNMQLWVQPEDCDNGVTNVLYSSFKIGSLAEKFKLTTSYGDGDAGDAFNVVSFGVSDQGRPFSTAATYDPTNGLPVKNCVSLQYGGWWHGSCKDNLNGKWYSVRPPYCETTVPDGIRWIRPGNFTLMRSKMFVCPTCDKPF